MKAEHIRNFSIIAHIDHGKSTLADRLLELTGALSPREMMDQVLDDMDLERERGITIKSHSVRLNYTASDGQRYVLNLIDTPGHVDFSYEVSRSLAACEGALLVVDAAQGVEAQTLANTYMAIDHDLTIIPVINKIDLPTADVDRVKEQLENIIGFDVSQCLEVSAKEGWGIKEVMEAIINQIEQPKGSYDKPLKALIFDSWFNPYQGAIILVRVMDGKLSPGNRIRLMSTNRSYEVSQVGIFTPKMTPVEELTAGEVGWVAAGIKQISDTKIGDTVTEDKMPASEPLPGFKEVKPMVFCGLYPASTSQFEMLRDALEKLRLNDSSFSFEPESSKALGFGFRCGFLGLLHMEIIQQRLEREFDLDLISTAPGVRYNIVTKTEERQELDNPAKLPPEGSIATIEEPYITATIITDDAYIGQILKLAEERRGVQKRIEYLSQKRILIIYELPLNEIIFDFYDKLKSVSRGYASLDYKHSGFRTAELVKLDILVNGQPVDALSIIVHKEKAYNRGRVLVTRMKEVIPRQLFEVALQAAIGKKVIARETIKALRKNVIAKCYGGDITRKRKLLERQKEGKKRMKRIGKVDIPQEAFLALLKSQQ